MVPHHTSAMTRIKRIQVREDRSHDMKALREPRETEDLHTQRDIYVKTQ